MGNKEFPLEKILTIGAQDYYNSVGKTAGKYIMQGINMQVFNEDIDNVHSQFARKVPKYTEAVVGYNFSISVSISRALGENGGYAKASSKTALASGTALIPKSKWKRYLDPAKKKKKTLSK